MPESRKAGVYRGGVALLCMLAAATVFAHGGGLDGRGCHRDSSAGNYHCHDGPREGQTFPSKSAYGGGAGETTDPSSGGGYDRSDYHSSWRDRDGDCRDTREEVLIAESREPVEFETDRECNVVGGLWRDPYSGRTFTNPSDLDIDHLVPLAEAHASGAADWPARRKHRYANDLGNRYTLIAVSLGENRSKGSRGPAEWMPDNERFHCEYLERWVAVKRAWDLTMDADEKRAVRSGLADCR